MIFGVWGNKKVTEQKSQVWPMKEPAFIYQPYKNGIDCLERTINSIS